MKLTDFKALTFDCYGTLIDWESGLTRALNGAIAKAGRAPAEVLETFAKIESEQQSETPSMPYSQLLSVVYQRLVRQLNVTVTIEDAQRFGASIPDWPAFSDSPDALAQLKKHYRLIILSNVDRVSFRGSQARLKVEFDAVYTAQDIGSYKPNLRNFEYLLQHAKEEFGLERRDILHVAQSLYHDHVPAKQLGFATAWIDRRCGAEGWGATKPPADMPKYDFRFESMAALAVAHQQELGMVG